MFFKSDTFYYLQFYKLQNLILDIKSVTYSMIKSSNKKRFKKDIHILKIQGNTNYCKQHEDSNCKECYIFDPIGTNKNFTKSF